MSSISSLPFTLGAFRITPQSRLNACGQFLASLSIRRGKGRQSNDRVYTFTPLFATEDSALSYAAVQGRYWLLNPASFA